MKDTGPVRRDSVLADRWTGRGASKVTGHVDAGIVDIEGALTVGGTLRAGSLRIVGPLDVVGPARVDGAAEIVGPARCGQSFEAGDLESRGPFSVRGPIQVPGLAQFQGDVTLADRATFGRFVGAGSLEAPRGLTAGSVTLEVHRDSSIGQITAGSVVVKRPPGPPFKMPFFGKERPRLTVLRIEASEVRLDGVDVEVVRADRVDLGADCHVARVIGEVRSVDPSSHIGPESRSPPPYGIHR